MTSLELLQEIDAWLSFNNHPSKKQINELRNNIKKHISEQLNISVVQQSGQLVCPNCKLPFTKEELQIKEHCFNCGREFAEAEFIERERLLEIQQSRTRWLTLEEFNRLRELNDKLKLKHETKMMNIEREIQNILDRNFTRGDNANALKELLVLYNAVEQSEQLVCSCGSRLVKTTGGYHCGNAKCSI